MLSDYWFDDYWSDASFNKDFDILHHAIEQEIANLLKMLINKLNNIANSTNTKEGISKD